MNKFRTKVSVILMVITGIIGFFVGKLLDGEGLNGAILFSLITGIACVIYTIDNKNK